MNPFQRIALKIILVMAISMSSQTMGSASATSAFMPRDHIVIDLSHGIEWLRCSVGQNWNGETCVGEIVKLNHESIKEAIRLANEQLGGEWRLPTLKELKGLICMECGEVKIDLEVFPSTSPEPYWTGERNPYASRHIYTVNFINGYTYGRFFPFQEMAVRLVQDR